MKYEQKCICIFRVFLALVVSPTTLILSYSFRLRLGAICIIVNYATLGDTLHHDVYGVGK